MSTTPIWQDIRVDLGAKSEALYSLQVRGVEIYAGKAVRRPGDASIFVKINEPLANYLSQEIPKAPGVTLRDQLEAPWSVVADSANPAAGNVRLDWSYDPSGYAQEVDANAGILSDPISRKISPRQYFLFSRRGGEAEKVKLTTAYKDGTADDALIGAPSPFNYVAAPVGDKVRALILNGREFPVTQGCEGFALYYVNAYGGWDSLLLEGRALKADEYNRHTFRKDNRTDSFSDASRINYLNEISRTFRLRTGLFAGSEGQKMHHLLGSTLVYLHDLSAPDKIYPVTITDNRCEYKSYKTSGAQLYQYELIVEISRNYQRK